MTMLGCHNPISTQAQERHILPGIHQVEKYIPLLVGKKVAIIVNHTSTMDDLHLVDLLIAKDISVKKIFTPEHGYKGTADAGEQIADHSHDGIEIVSLYGKNKRPTAESLNGIDILLFDIQDVGVRFYTYISTLHYVMDAAAEYSIPLIVLDRPNPLASIVDGPVLDMEFKSFVGMHPVPVIYGMTIGEYALMINGENWLDIDRKADLTIIRIENYDHSIPYVLPIAPSPNLRNNIAIGHYPSLCFFEGTSVSVGRGTDTPFMHAGHPEFSDSQYAFQPQSGEGSKYPKHENTKCYGVNLQKTKPYQGIDLSYLIRFYENLNTNNISFFNDNNFFDLLAGTSLLKQDIIGGKTEEEIKNSWKDDIRKFKLIREKYLIYD